MAGTSTGQPSRASRGLMTLVIVMGVMIVLGLGVIVFEIGRRLFTPPRPAAEAAMPRGAPTSLRPEINVPVPEGAQILSTWTADNRLWVEMQLADGTIAAWAIDLATGTVVSRVQFKPGARPTSQ